MPNGFIGRAAMSYLGEVSSVHTRAVSESRQTPVRTPLENRAHQLPFSPEDARSGGFTTGKGNSSNVVADRRTYEEIARSISRADDEICECLYHVALEIENMCRTSYQMPGTSLQCQNVADSIKRTINETRSLTEEVVILTNSFARDITEIE